MAGLAAALDPAILGQVKPFAQVMAGQQAQQLAGQQAQIENFAKQFQLAGQIVGNSATDQPSYDKARAFAQTQGIDTGFLPDKFDPDVIQHLRFAGATPTAQLSALIASQGHDLRAGIASGDVGSYGYQPSNTAVAPSPAPPSPALAANKPQVADDWSTPPNPQGAPSPVTPAAAAGINNLYSETPAKPVVLTDNTSQPVNSSPAKNIVAPPTQNPGETVQKYKSRLEAWKTDPTNASFVAENEAGGKNTIESSNKLDADTKAAQNMLYSISTLKDAASQFQSGAAAPAKLSLMRIARAAGVPLDQSEVDSISNMQAFTKVANDIIGQAAKAEGQASRLAAAFQTIKQANPNIGLEPETLGILFDKMGAQANNIIDEQQNWNTQKNQNPTMNFTNFERNYLANQSTQQRQMGGKLPSTQDNKSAPPAGATLYGTSKGKSVYKMPDGSFLMEQ